MNTNPTGKDFRAAAANFITGKATIADLNTMKDRIGQTLTEPLTPKPLNLKDLSTGQKLTTIFFWGIKTEFPLYLIPKTLEFALEKAINAKKAEIDKSVSKNPLPEDKVVELAKLARAEVSKKSFDEAQAAQARKDEAEALKRRQHNPKDLEAKWQEIETKIKQVKESMEEVKTEILNIKKFDPNNTDYQPLMLKNREELAKLVKEKKEVEAQMEFEEVDLGPVSQPQKSPVSLEDKIKELHSHLKLIQSERKVKGEDSLESAMKVFEKGGVDFEKESIFSALEEVKKHVSSPTILDLASEIKAALEKETLKRTPGS